MDLFSRSPSFYSSWTISVRHMYDVGTVKSILGDENASCEKMASSEEATSTVPESRLFNQSMK